MGILRLYHTGFQKIEQPDIRVGRRNADFGQGFYLSDDEEFSKRWAKQRKGRDTVLNTYELTVEGLNVKHFSRDAEWFDYIFRNRSGYKDSLSDYDIIIGPIANDTIYDTWGIITSGLLQPSLALELLQIGPQYQQIVIKTNCALLQLRYISASILVEKDLITYKEAVIQEEHTFQSQLAERLSREQDDENE